MASLVQPSKYQFFDINGNPLVGGKVFFYVPNTLTLKDTYQNQAQSILNTNPVILNARGEMLAFLDGLYDVTLKDSLNNVIYTLEDVGLGGSQNWVGDLLIDGNLTVTGDVEIDGTVVLNTKLDGSYIADHTVTELQMQQNPWTNVASAATVDIASVPSQNIDITGTVNISAFSTADSGVFRRLKFEDALTLVYNATTLILPGGANITTTAGDTAEIVSLGGGAWIVTQYQHSVTTIGLVVVTQTFTGNGTYTPSSGMLYAEYEAIGGGGGGGGCTVTGGANSSGGGGGSSGRYASGILSAADIGASKPITIGTGGAGGLAGANNGGAGTSTSIGALVVCPGGPGGIGAAAVQAAPGGAAAAAYSGSVAAAVTQATPGHSGFSTVYSAIGGPGANGLNGMGGGTLATLNAATGSSAAGNPATGYGAGGSGGATATGGPSRAGGAGSAGIVIITEFCEV